MKSAVVTVLNNNYILGALTTFYSIVKNTPGFKSDIIVLDWGDLSDLNKQKLKTIYKNTFFKPIETSLYERCEYDSTNRKWLYNCNYRFEIFCLKEYDKVIFIDTDFLVLESVQPLIELDCNFGVVKSIPEYIPQYAGRDCFDAGLMVIGKEYLNEKVRSELIELSLSPAPLIKNGTNLWASDEPILNTYFENKKTMLPLKYNFLTSLLDANTCFNNNNFQFNGPKKPWTSTKLEDCFNDHTCLRIIDEHGTGIGLLSLLRLHKLYLKYMNEAIALSI
jgi:lipopolysaccharide biosynthesis glycosyltransferase